MRRHVALQDMSRDHHSILMHARRLLGEEPRVDVATARRKFLLFKDAILRHHFAEEEQALAGLIRDQDQARRLTQEHAGLLRDAERLATGTGADGEAFQRTFGWRLRDHVRFEEDDLFPALERELSVDQWDRVAAIAKSHRGQTRPPSASPGAREECFL